MNKKVNIENKKIQDEIMNLKKTLLNVVIGQQVWEHSVKFCLIMIIK